MSRKGGPASHVRENSTFPIRDGPHRSTVATALAGERRAQRSDGRALNYALLPAALQHIDGIIIINSRRWTVFTCRPPNVPYGGPPPVTRICGRGHPGATPAPAHSLIALRSRRICMLWKIAFPYCYQLLIGHHFKNKLNSKCYIAVETQRWICRDSNLIADVRLIRFLFNNTFLELSINWNMYINYNLKTKL